MPAACDQSAYDLLACVTGDQGRGLSLLLNYLCDTVQHAQIAASPNAVGSLGIHTHLVWLDGLDCTD